MRNFIYLSLLVIVGISSFVTFTFGKLNAVTLVSTSPMAKSAIEKLEKIKEYPALIKEIEKEGPVRLEMLDLPGEQFDAFWDSTDRTIRINMLKNKNFDVLVVSILFELHNAKSDTRFKQLYTMAKAGQITKEQYVENVERMEHQNALNTSNIVEKGIKLGILNPGARWPILRSFDDHYKLQQIKDHSQWIARSYDRMSPYGMTEDYVGTLPKVLSSNDKADMIRYLRMKNEIEGQTKENALKGVVHLKKEYESLEACYLGTSTHNCVRTHERIQLLQDVFKDNSEFHVLIQNSPIHLLVQR